MHAVISDSDAARDLRFSAASMTPWSAVIIHIVPFTLSQAAAALPFRHTRLIWSAVVVGCFAPDFEYFLRLAPKGGFGHTLLGMFVLDLPVALLVVWLFHRFAKEPLYVWLPDGVRQRVELGPNTLPLRSPSKTCARFCFHPCWSGDSCCLGFIYSSLFVALRSLSTPRSNASISSLRSRAVLQSVPTRQHCAWRCRARDLVRAMVSSRGSGPFANRRAISKIWSNDAHMSFGHRDLCGRNPRIRRYGQPGGDTQAREPACRGGYHYDHRLLAGGRGLWHHPQLANES